MAQAQGGCQRRLLRAVFLRLSRSHELLRTPRFPVLGTDVCDARWCSTHQVEDDPVAFRLRSWTLSSLLTISRQ